MLTAGNVSAYVLAAADTGPVHGTLSGYESMIVCGTAGASFDVEVYNPLTGAWFVDASPRGLAKDARVPVESPGTSVRLRRAAGFVGDISYVITGVGVASPSAYPSAVSAALLAKLKRLATTAAAGNPLTLPVYSGVTVTTPASADASLSQQVFAPLAASSPKPQRFAFHGGTPTQFPGQPWLLFPVSDITPQAAGNLGGYLPSTPTVNAWTWEAEFRSDAPVMEISFLAFLATNVRILVDGQYVSASPTVPAAYSGAQLVRLVFSGGRKDRRIQFRGRGAVGFRGVSVSPLDSVSAPDTGSTIRVAVTGDSYGEGIGTDSPSDPDAAYGVQLGHLMGWNDIRQVAVGATGYVVDAGGLRSTVIQQIPRWGFTPDVIVCASGFNDQGSNITAAATATAALATWKAMREAAPNARIFVLGPWSGNRAGGANGVGATCAAVDAALAAQFAVWGDPCAHYIPVAADDPPWTTGTGRVGATDGSGNSDIYISTDSVHPNSAGHAYLAQRAATAIRSILGAL